MSAISGIFRLDDRPIDSSMLKKMNLSLAHRGPDSFGLWWDESIGFGHQMCWMSPDSLKEKLPLADQAMNVFLTADARLDNREDIYRALALYAKRLDETSDSELILAAYLKWGRELTKRIMGDYAFAIWDKKAGILYCARDIFGVKPFYYYYSEKIFAFASEIKALLSLPGVPKRPNQAYLADYLTQAPDDKESTFYEEIFRLPPAKEIIVTHHKLWMRRTWAPDLNYEVKYKADEECAERFGTIFASAVKSRLRSAYKVGAILDADLASSSIVSVARLLMIKEGKKIYSLSMISNNPEESDERDCIQELALQSGVLPLLVRTDLIPPFFDFKRMFWHLDQVASDNLSALWGGLYEEAGKNDIRTLLCAEGAKEFFGVSSQTTEPDGILADLFNSGFAKFIKLRYALRKSRLAEQSLWGALGFDQITRRLESQNHMGAAMNIQPSYPFLDKRVVEFCLALLPKKKLDNHRVYQIAKNAMKATVAEKARVFQKDFKPNSTLTSGLLKYERPTLEESIFNPIKSLEPYIDFKRLKKTYTHFLNKPTHQAAISLWKITSLSLWFQEMDFD